MKKSSKRIVLSTESKNDKGFHVLTSGIDLTQYKKNPVLLWMHQRPEGKSKDEVLPLGNGLDLMIDNDQISFVPSFDDTDDFALSIYNKYENGTLRSASAGLIPIEWEKRGMEVWLVKSILVEITLCDIGSNSDALTVALYNEEGLVNLTAGFLDSVIPNSNQKDMKKIELNADKALTMVNLSQDATDEDFLKAVEKAIELNATQGATILTLTKEKDEAITAQKEAEAELEKLQKETANAELVQLVNDAEQKGQITKEQRVDFLGDEENGIEALSVDKAKSILELLPENKSVEEKLKSGEGGDFLKLVADKSYKELEADGLLIELLSKNPELFNTKYRAHFGVDYQKKD